MHARTTKYFTVYFSMFVVDQLTVLHLPTCVLSLRGCLLLIIEQLMVGAERARSLLSTKQETRRTIVHLLGEAGVGKSTLKNTLSRGYFSSFFNVRVAKTDRFF